VDALHGAGLQPFGFGDLESGGLDEGELAAGEVLTGRADGDPFQEPLGGVNRRPGAADVVEQQQPAARDQDALHFADRRRGAGDRAQRQRADHGVEGRVAAGQVLGVALLEVDGTAEAGGALAGDGEHRGAQLDPGDGRIGRVVGQVAAGADGDLQDPAVRALAEVGSVAGEEGPVAMGHRSLPGDRPGFLASFLWNTG
jgi:hypothetical protein